MTTQMGFEKSKNYPNHLKIINELIEKYYNILTIDINYITELVPELNKLKKEFEPKYLKYINIKRFAIPIIGRISSGKSTFLNFLLGLKDILQTDTKITTRFVCIIRYNEKAEKPKAFNVKLEERKLKINSKNDRLKFNFEKGDEIKGKNIHEIIKERNEKISKSDPHTIKNEEFFMIIEFKIPIFNEEKLIKYSEIFEFMDLPGLNQYDDGKINFFVHNILPIITPNVKFSLFIFDCLTLKDIDTLDIYKKYINLGNNNQNNFYIINKIDLSKNENEEEEFKKYIIENCKISENENNFIGTNSRLLSLENEKYNNFDTYLNYKETEINYDDEHEKDFVIYLKDEMEKEFNLKIESTKINDSDSKKDTKRLEIFLSEYNNKLEDKNFGGTLEIEDYLFFENIFKEKNVKGEKNSETAKFFYKNLSKSFKASLDSFFDIEQYKNSLNELMKKISSSTCDFYKILEEIKKKNDYKYSMQKIKEIKPIIQKLKELEPNNDFINGIQLGYDDLEAYINKDRKIRIAFLGVYSSGKSTIINTLIGKEILPTNNNECTKRGIIIRYHNKDIPELYETKFIEKNDYYCFKDSNNLICEGYMKIKEKLFDMYKENVNFEDSFLVVKVKINLLDDLNLEDELKQKIEFIDFPGLNTENNFYQQNIFNHLMKFTDGFNFINKDDLIKDNSNVKALKDIINRIESRKFKFDLDTCLFILNNFSNNTNFNSQQPKRELEEIFCHEINEKFGFWSTTKNQLNFNSNKELNVVQFNPKFYQTYMKFEKEISNFENFFISINENKKDQYTLWKYFERNYCDKFPSEIKEYKQLDSQINQYYDKLTKILKLGNKNDKNINDQLYKCCQAYDYIKKNTKLHKKYKDSNAEELFEKIKNQIYLIKKNLDNNFKEIYLNYMTNLIYTFELIKINILGDELYLEKNMNEKKKYINNKYIICKDKINEKFNDLKKNSLEKIDDFIKNIKKSKNPIDESKDIYNEISKSLSDFLLFFEEESNKFNKELDVIMDEIISKIKLKIDLNNSTFKKFMNIKHLYSHIGIGFFEGFGGLLYMGLIGINPIGFFLYYEY